VKRAALVTGAAGGLGRAIAQRLIDDGLDVLAVDVAPDPGGPGVPFTADLTRRDANRAAVAAAIETFGRLDVIVANAGVQHVAPVAEFPEDTWDTLVALMLTSPFLLARYGWPSLRASPDARFVAVASAHGLVASPNKCAYVAAKHGVVGLVKTLALEGADDGILATAVCPGFVRTPLVEAQLEALAAADGDELPEDVLLRPHAVKRLLEPHEVAATVSFLVGSAGRAFTGVALSPDLGWTAR
jgi:3-hydroxybutyrate dehydrogenase